VELPKFLLAVLEILLGFPCIFCVAESFPFDEILFLVSLVSHVENAFYFVLFVCGFDLHGFA